MRLWVTRSQPGAQATAARLEAMGHSALVAPVLHVEHLDFDPPHWDGVGALAFTSAAGVSGFSPPDPPSADPPWKALPVFAVGEATASAAREAGWSDVRCADGDGAALARLIVSARAEIAGGVLAPGAREPAFDLPAALAGAGIAAQVLPVYATVSIAAPPALVVEALVEGGLDGLLVHSPAAARAIAAFALADLDFAAALQGRTAFALSAACAAALPPLFATPPRAATAPRERDLLALVPHA